MGSAISSLPVPSTASLKGVNPKNELLITGGMIFLSLGSLGLFIATCVLASNINYTTDKLNDVRSKYLNVWGISIGGILAFLISICIYINKYPDKGIYFGLVTACIALGISFNALAISAISKKTP